MRIPQCLQIGPHPRDGFLDAVLGQRGGDDTQALQEVLLRLCSLWRLVHELLANPILSPSSTILKRFKAPYLRTRAILERRLRRSLADDGIVCFYNTVQNVRG